MDDMEEYNLKSKKMGNVYSPEEIKQYMSEIRLALTEGDDPLTDEKALAKIEEYVFSIKKAQSCSYRQNSRLIERLFLSLRKEMDILQPYMDDKSISEIMVNGRENIFAERHGKIERLPIAFDTTEDLEELIRRIASRVHREINELSPIVDARLSDGSRVNAVYKNIALNGPILTIRKFPDKVMDMEELVKASLRMRPDRIVIGEVRGKEVMDMIQAMNTGQGGFAS